LHVSFDRGLLALTALTAIRTISGEPALAQQPQKPNILVIMADDIGYWNISAYNRGMMGYRTPNIDRIANEGAIFTDYYGQQSCTAGRAAFVENPASFNDDGQSRAQFVPAKHRSLRSWRKSRASQYQIAHLVERKQRSKACFLLRRPPNGPTNRPALTSA
jgi:hypothetical protein